MVGSADADTTERRASTLELFFDLVFVFTITQLTHAFTEHPGWPAVLRIALVFGLIWWMYSGYVWLTNEVAPNNSVRRGWLLVGMFGFFILALAIPEAFHDTGAAFGLAYVLVTAVHTALFHANGGPSAARAILRIAPLNALSAGFVLAGGLAPDRLRYLCWSLAFAIQLVSPYLIDSRDFVIRAGHLCERHGLIIIIAIGESIIAIGVGLTGEPITFPLVATLAMALALAFVLWWAYFGSDDERGARALAAIPRPTRATPAVTAYGFALYPLLIGIIMTAAGLSMSIAHGGRSATVTAATALSGGVALYFCGQFLFRRILGLPHAWHRLIAAPVVGSTIPVGIAWTAGAQLTALVAVATAAVAFDRSER
ncbi:low temperature requirement protein A [Nocardia inohanensis]|uniref:low temperature requirement protein A n=1 Tax=Nocardia inohanensis TaxID=209246 RepID=UPI00082E3B17|nr:low temperature requirement protein A [Nocardia inohanensis]